MSKWLLSKEEMERIIKRTWLFPGDGVGIYTQEVAKAQVRKIIDELEKEVQGA